MSIEVKNLHFSYGEREILKDVSNCAIEDLISKGGTATLKRESK